MRETISLIDWTRLKFLCNYCAEKETRFLSPPVPSNVPRYRLNKSSVAWERLCCLHYPGAKQLLIKQGGCDDPMFLDMDSSLVFQGSRVGVNWWAGAWRRGWGLWFWCGDKWPSCFAAPQSTSQSGPINQLSSQEIKPTYWHEKVAEHLHWCLHCDSHDCHASYYSFSTTASMKSLTLPEWGIVNLMIC